MHHFSDWFSKGVPLPPKRNAGGYKKACCFLYLLPSSSMALLHKARRVFRRAAEHRGREAHHEREDEELRLAACCGASSLFRRASQALHKSSVNRNVAKLSRFWATVRKSEAACYINRLPTELLSLIFTISADNASHYLDSDFVPFTLTHVCTLWRDIAVDLATLWHRFDLKPCLGTGRHAHLATICAKRAKGLGLAISYVEPSPFDFDETENVCDGNAAEFAEFCECRLQLIGRITIGQIRSLALVIGEPSAVKLALSTRDNIAIALEDLTVLFSGHVSDSEALAPFYSSPALRRLRLSSTHEQTVRLTIDLAYPMGVSWQQLLAVDPLDLLWDMLADMADKGKATHYIKACMHWTDELNDIPGQPRLTMVIIGEEPLNSVVLAPPIISLLHSLGFAPPRHAHEAQTGRPLQSSWTFLQSLRDVSECLATLSIGQCRQLDELTLIKCIELPRMARLQRLGLAPMQLGVLCDQFIRSLQADGSGNMLLPELAALALCPCTTSVDGIVERMLESRRAFSSSLRIVDISFDETGQHDLDKRFIEEHFQTFWEE